MKHLKSYGLSIGTYILDATHNSNGGIDIIKGELFETSLVNRPANQLAGTLSIKSATPREIERKLREMGFSQKSSKEIVSVYMKSELETETTTEQEQDNQEQEQEQETQAQVKDQETKSYDEQKVSELIDRLNKLL